MANEPEKQHRPDQEHAVRPARWVQANNEKGPPPAPRDVGIRGLNSDQVEYYRQIRKDDPSMSAKDALETARSSRRLDANDVTMIAHALQKLAAFRPKPINEAKDPNLIQYEITFDGTWSDRDEMAFQTNPALINNLFEGAKHYEKGVGTDPETALVGGAFGAGLSNRIESAYATLVTFINDEKRKNPKAEVVLIVSGFSRGSTAARAFVNELNRRGIPELSSKRPDGSYASRLASPRIGAMILFDTVGSIGIPGTNPDLDLTIPANAENVLHLTAAHERRAAFPLSKATDGKQLDDPRILELELPGAHSDVGGGYPNRYSQIPLSMAHKFLEASGAAIEPTDEKTPSPFDKDLRVHDVSGGGIAALLQTEKRRAYSSVNPAPSPEVATRGTKSVVEVGNEGPLQVPELVASRR